MDQNEYIQERVDDQIGWYDKKSITNKRSFIFLSITQIIAGVLITFLAGIESFASYKMTASTLGLIIAIIAGLLGILKFQENWVNYRTAAESLKHEKYRFLTKSSPYDIENAFQIFVENIEKLISRTHSVWRDHLDENAESSESKE